MLGKEIDAVLVVVDVNATYVISSTDISEEGSNCLYIDKHVELEAANQKKVEIQEGPIKAYDGPRPFDQGGLHQCPSHV